MFIRDIVRCTSLRAVCSGAFDDVDEDESVKEATTKPIDIIEKINRARRRQAGIHEALTSQRALYDASKNAVERQAIEQQMKLLLDSYKQESKRLETLENLRTKYESTRSTLETAEIVKDTTEMERELIERTKKAFNGETAESLLRKQIHTANELEQFQEITKIVASPEEEQARRLGIPVASLRGNRQQDGPSSTLSEIDELLGLGKPIELPVFPPVITTPPSSTATPYTSPIPVAAASSSSSSSYRN